MNFGELDFFFQFGRSINFSFHLPQIPLVYISFVFFVKTKSAFFLLMEVIEGHNCSNKAGSFIIALMQ